MGVGVEVGSLLGLPLLLRGELLIDARFIALAAQGVCGGVGGAVCGGFGDRSKMILPINL